MEYKVRIGYLRNELGSLVVNVKQAMACWSIYMDAIFEILRFANCAEDGRIIMPSRNVLLVLTCRLRFVVQSPCQRNITSFYQFLNALIVMLHSLSMHIRINMPSQ